MFLCLCLKGWNGCISILQFGYMELHLPTLEPCPPSRWQCPAQLHGIPTTKVFTCMLMSTAIKSMFNCKPTAAHKWLPVSKVKGMLHSCVGAFLRMADRRQVLVGTAPYSQIVGSLFKVIREHAKCSSWMTEANPALPCFQLFKYVKLVEVVVCISN